MSIPCLNKTGQASFLESQNMNDVARDAECPRPQVCPGARAGLYYAAIVFINRRSGLWWYFLRSIKGGWVFYQLPQTVFLPSPKAIGF